MGLAILGVLVLSFIALAVLSAKSWQIWHVLIVSALFVATFVFCAFAAATLRTHERWRSQYEQAKVQLATAQQRFEQLTRTDPNSDEPTVAEISGDVRRVLVDRGRVWRNLVLADVGEGTVTLDASSWGDEACQRVGVGSDFDEVDDFVDEEPPEPIPAEGEAAAGPTKPLGLQSNAIVFAFQETPIASLPEPIQQILFGENPLPKRDRKGLCKIPSFYLGEFKITNDPQAEPTTITLSPTLPLSELQIEQLQNPDATWVLYEMLPVDSHEAFAGITKEQIELLIPPWTEDGQPDEAYDALIDAFVRHGLRASDMDPPDRKWMRVKFTQAKDLVVDVQEPTSLPDTPFDPSGRSISDNLRQNEQSKFRPNDVVLLDFATAQEFINEGVAEAIEPIYQRPLRDFERFFRNSAGEMDAIGGQIAVAQEDLTKLDGSITNLRQQIAFFTEREQRLTEDRDGFNMERTVITEYRSALEDRWKEVLSELSRLYRANKQLVAGRSSPDDDSAARPDRRTLSSRGEGRR